MKYKIRVSYAVWQDAEFEVEADDVPHAKLQALDKAERNEAPFLMREECIIKPLFIVSGITLLDTEEKTNADQDAN